MKNPQFTIDQAKKIYQIAKDQVYYTGELGFITAMEAQGYIEKPRIEILKDEVSRLGNKAFNDMSLNDYKILFEYIRLLEKRNVT